MKFQKGVISLATLALVAACSGHKHRNDNGNGGQSPKITVGFKSVAGLGLAGPAVSDLSVSHWSVQVKCDDTDWVAVSDNMASPPTIEYGLTGCATKLSSVTVVRESPDVEFSFSSMTTSADGSSQAPQSMTDTSGNTFHYIMSSRTIADQLSPGVSSDIKLDYVFSLSAAARGTVATSPAKSLPITTSFRGIPLPSIDPTVLSASIDAAGIHLLGLTGAPGGCGGDGQVYLAFAALAAGENPSIENASVRKLPTVQTAISNDVLNDSADAVFAAADILTSCIGKQAFVQASVGCQDPTIPSQSSDFYVTLPVSIVDNSSIGGTTPSNTSIPSSSYLCQ